VNCREVGRLLDAYVDNELTLSESAEIGEHVEDCADCHQRLADLESLGRLIRSLPTHIAPGRLRAALTARPARRRVAPRALAVAVAAAAVMIASIGAGLAVRAVRSRQTVGDSVAEAVISSHVRALMGEHLLDVPTSDQHTVKPWFLGRLDFSPPVTDLGAAGYPLVGGRLDYVAGRPVAAVVYKRRQHTINLFIWPAAVPDASIEAGSIRGFQVRHWVRGRMTFWAVSDLNDQELDAFARALRR
jgi:anti-sigma factor RsiW